MSRLALRGLVLASVIALLGVASYAIAGGGSRSFKAKPLTGYQETPLSISSTATGEFTARLNDAGTSLHYKLTYSGLEGAVTQAHVHFGARATSGGVSFFLCGTAAAPGPAGTPACPTPGGTVEGDITAAQVIGPVAQGIEVGAFNEILAAMRAGVAYANVHSTKWPGGEVRAQLKKGHGDDKGKKGHDDD
jgi:CHRD domain-containing protein